MVINNKSGRKSKEMAMTSFKALNVFLEELWKIIKYLSG
jgi:hypothetical protein